MLTDQSFQLHSFQLCGAGNPAVATPTTQPVDDTQDIGQSSAAKATSLSALRSTQVVLEVDGNGGSTAPLRYRCPAYLVQRGSATLRVLLEDVLENGESTAQCTVDPRTADGAAESEPSLLPEYGGSSLVLPLPFVDKDVFEVVAVYIEHFYTLSVWGSDTAATDSSSVRVGGLHDAKRLSTSSTKSADLAHTTEAPSALRRPLNFADLYGLSSWEHHFVLYCVLGLTWRQVTSLGLAENGRWVDLVGGAVRKLTGDFGATQEVVEVFSIPNRQRMWRRLSAVLEAATRLGVVPLQLLCACIAANMLMDLDEGSVGQLVGGGERVVQPFTPESRANLLQRFPWLSRDQKSTSGTTVM